MDRVAVGVVVVGDFSGTGVEVQGGEDEVCYWGFGGCGVRREEGEERDGACSGVDVQVGLVVED